MLAKSLYCLMIITLLLSFSHVADAKLLFKDDFEGDKVGNPPKNFEEYNHAHNAAGHLVEISEDPNGESGKVTHTFNYALYIPIAAGRDNWSDWVWEWDWMWSELGFPGTAFRITGDNYYHISPRNDNVSVGFWYYDGNWNQIGALVQYDFGSNIWNRYQVIADGENITLRIKRRDDPTPFSEIDPLLEVTDNNLTKGPVSVCGTNTDAWMDNFILGETETDLSFAVESAGKLAISWGMVKNEAK